MYLIDERTDHFVQKNEIESYFILRLAEMKVEPVAFIVEYRRQNRDEKEMNLQFIRFGFKYNYIFNERLGRPLDYPTWREFVVDCLREPMEKNRLDIDRGLWARNNPGKPLPKHLEYGYQKYP